MRHSALYIALMCALSLQASESVDILTSAAATCDANVALKVQRLSNGEVVDAYRANNLIPPASTIKLFTTATALEMYGADYRFATPLTYDGTLQNGVLSGNLYIEGRGDPTLGGADWGNEAFLNQWVSAIRKAGIRSIKGGVVADLSYYDGDAVNPGWLWEDIGNYYAPGIFALAYKDNTLSIQLQSGAYGSLAQVVKTIPDMPDLVFENHIRCTEIDKDGAFVHGVPYQNCRYLTGSIPSNMGLFGIKGDLPNPGLLLAQHLTTALRRSGISVRSEADYTCQRPSKTRTVLYTHNSAPLSSIVAKTNMRSINLNAEMLFRNLSAVQSVPCTIHNAVDVLKQFWNNRGVGLYSARILDGCGLAPQNGVSPEQFVRLLMYMANSPVKDAFFQSLPVSGKSGTLKSLLAKTELAGRVHAKSGTIKGTRNYAGYIDLPDGDQLVFAVMVNSSVGTNAQIQHAIEQYLLDVYRRNK